MVFILAITPSMRAQELETQAVGQLLEQGLARQDARSGARELQASLDAVRSAEAAVDKLHRSLSRHKVRGGGGVGGLGG